MVIGIIDQPVVGKDNAPGPSRGAAHSADVALGPDAALPVGQQAFVVAEAAAADGPAGSQHVQGAAGPAVLGLGLLLGHVLGGQLAVKMDIQGHIVLVIILSVLGQRGAFRLLGLLVRPGPGGRGLTVGQGLLGGAAVAGIFLRKRVRHRVQKIQGGVHILLGAGRQGKEHTRRQQQAEPFFHRNTSFCGDGFTALL